MTSPDGPSLPDLVLDLAERARRLPDSLRSLVARWREDLVPRRRKVPTVLQMEAVECGAAALGMVLGHWGRHVPLEELRTAAGVSRDGSKASNMLKAARRYGLEAKGLKTRPDKLRDLQLPAILHWNFNHFVVLEGFRGDRVYLNDPKCGPLTVPFEELDQAFTGVVLTFEPAPDFEEGGERRGLVSGLAPRLAGSGPGVLYVVLAGFGLLVPGMLVPTFSRIFVDNVLIRDLAAWLRPLLLVMGGTALVLAGLTWLRQRFLLRLETKLALTTSAELFWHVLKLPVEFFSQRFAGDIGNRVRIADRVASLLSRDLATTALNIVVVAFYALVMVQYDLVLTVVGVGVALLNLAALKLVSRKRVDLNQRRLQDRGKLMGVAMGGLQTIETLKATGSESDFFSRWSGHQAKLVNADQKMGLLTQTLTSIPPLLLGINTAVILGIGGLRVMDGHLSMGMLMAYHGLMVAFLSPVNRFVRLGGKVQEAAGDLNRLDDVLQAEADPHAVADAPLDDGASPGVEVLVSRGGDGAGDGPAGAVGTALDGAPKLTGKVEIRDVSFGYNPLEDPLIEDFSLRMDPGDRVALVGGSGSGKSTVAKLVAGLYEPWEGSILFDGVPRGEIPRPVMTSSLAMVDQEIFLFEGTVQENLTMWDETVDEGHVIAGARDAEMHDEITRRGASYEAPVEEGGRNFSGGQRQRLEIARALAGAPSVLVLDEATSALDPTTEKSIDGNLRRRGITCLIVAHRLSTIRDCDEIVVLDAGSIVERGVHQRLVERDGIYRDLIEHR